MKYNTIVIYYLYLFIPISLLTGFMLRNNLTVAGLTPSLFATASITVLLFLKFIKKSFSEYKINTYVFSGGVIFLIFPFIYLLVYGFGNIWSEYNYSISIFSSLLIIAYISYYSGIGLFKLESIIHALNILLILNILISSLFGVGFPSYVQGGLEIGNKGYLYGGNTASALSLSVLAYYAFNDKIRKYYNIIYLCAAFYSAFLVKTIASILSPLFIVSYLYKNYKSQVLIIIVLFLSLIPLFADPIMDRVLDKEIDNYRLERMGITNFESISSSFLIYTDNSRRIQDSVSQIEFQIENPIAFIFGIGRSGQIHFYDSPNYNFSGMDIFDLLFRYGILGLTLIALVFVVPILKYIKVYGMDSLSTSSSILILYSIFGGYVFNSITILIYLAILISAMNIKMKYKH